MEELKRLRELTSKITSNGYLSDQTKAWQYAFDSVNEMVCITNKSLIIKFINKPLAKKLRIDPDQYINEHLSSILDEKLFTADNSSAVLETSESIYYGTSFVDELGVWVERKKYYITNEANKLIGYTFMLVDVTDKVEFEKNLKDNQALLEGVLDTIPDIITVQDDAQTVIKANRSAGIFFGLDTSEIVGKKCYELIGRDNPCHNCQTMICRTTKNVSKIEKFIPELDKWFDCRSYPILDDDGHIVKVVEHLRDISDIKADQDIKDVYYKKLIQEYKRINFIINSVDGYIWEKEIPDKGKEMVHKFVDPLFCKDFFGLEYELADDGYNACKLAYGKTSSELLEQFRSKGNRKHGFDEVCFLTDKHCIEQGKQCEYFEMGYIEHVKGEPEWFVLRVRKTPIFSDLGECTGILGFANNCSDDIHSIQELVTKGLERGILKKLSSNYNEVKVYWVLDDKNEEKSEESLLTHIDFP